MLFGLFFLAYLIQLKNQAVALDCHCNETYYPQVYVALLCLLYLPKSNGAAKFTHFFHYEVYFDWTAIRASRHQIIAFLDDNLTLALAG